MKSASIDVKVAHAACAGMFEEFGSMDSFAKHGDDGVLAGFARAQEEVWALLLESRVAPQMAAPATFCEELGERLSEGGEAMRMAAAWGFSLLGDAAAQGILCRALAEDVSVSVRAMAARALGRRREADEVVLGALCASLRDPAEEVRIAAVWALGNQEAQEAVVPLCALLVESQSDALCEAVLEALWQMGEAAVQAVEPLCRLLEQVGPSWRWRVAWVLGAIGDVRAVWPLLEADEDESQQVEGEALSALEAIGKAGVSQLLEACKHEELAIRLRAVEALDGIREPGAVGGLCEVLRDEELEVRQGAADALGELGRVAKEAVGALLALLEEEEPQGAESACVSLRQSVVWALGECAGGEATGALLVRLQDRGDGVAKAAAKGLATLALEHDAAYEGLQRASRDEDRWCALHALYGLSLWEAWQEREPGAVKQLATFGLDVAEEAGGEVSAQGEEGAGCVSVDAQGGTPAVNPMGVEERRLLRAQALQLCRDLTLEEPEALRESWQVLARAYEDEEEVNRRMVIQALGRLREVSALPVLLAACQDDADYVRAAAVQGVGWLGGGEQEARDALLAALEDPSSHVRLWAAKALGNLKDPEALEPLLRCVRREEGLALHPLRALGQLAHPGALPVLREAIEDGHPAVRAVAARGLGRIVGAMARREEHQDVLQALLWSAFDDDPMVREAAAEALGLCGAATPQVLWVLTCLHQRLEEDDDVLAAVFLAKLALGQRLAEAEESYLELFGHLLRRLEETVHRWQRLYLWELAPLLPLLRAWNDELPQQPTEFGTSLAVQAHFAPETVEALWVYTERFLRLQETRGVVVHREAQTLHEEILSALHALREKLTAIRQGRREVR